MNGPNEDDDEDEDLLERSSIEDDALYDADELGLDPEEDDERA